MILGFDPGRDKCGLAVMDKNRRIYTHCVVESPEAIASVGKLCQQYSIQKIAMGNLTTAGQWYKQLKAELGQDFPIEMVDEGNSSLEARDRYWQMYPPRGFMRLLPRGMRLPPRPVDDIVAILLIERYLAQQE
ncbi:MULTISPECIES: pre-16S rRNA-processing nuclease YqgF [Spirulina sp. CCY15215]|uniref:pre-16S rRNA-processing nuclease YqgF n=1 Tax=Spirulina sp. CCY15215 TaxID=2767591 RepID=UPI00195008FD|nr:pre-16S rRNA-processing nuclease YqgF [Spirulina major]